MKIGLGEMDIIWENKEENKKSCSYLMEQAKAAKVDFLVFPEMTLTGFSMDIEKIAESPEQSDTISFFKQESKRLHLAVGFGMAFKKQKKAVNHFIILDQEGNLQADYEKIHPFSYGKEAEFFEGGNEAVFCQIEGVNLSPVICYDLRFPELFQICSKKSSLILVIANWPKSRQIHWQTLLKARAIENQCFIAGINRVGSGDSLEYAGGSIVFDPYGEEISQKEKTTGLLTAQIDQSIVENYRKEFQVKKDRKEDLYIHLFQSSL